MADSTGGFAGVVNASVASGEIAGARDDPQPHPPRTARIYQGWIVVLGAFVAFTFASMVHTSFGLFVVPASAELGVSRADANNWLIVAGLGSAALAPFIGRLVDRVSVRLIMGLGGVILAASFVALGTTSSPWLIMALAIPVAFASDSAGGLAAATVTARWFRRRRGRALALVGISASAAGFALSPLAAYLIVEYGWRSALVIIGLLAGTVVVAMAVLLIRSAPTEEQLAVWEAPREAEAGEKRPHETRRWGYRELITNRNFLCLTAGIGLLFASDRAIMISLAPYLADGGFDLKMAGLMISALTGSSIIGKIFVGYIADYVDPRRIFLVVAAFHVVLLLVLIAQPHIWVMFAVALTMGLGVGGVLPVNQVLTVRIFGSTSFGTVAGTAVVFHQLFMMVAFRFIGEVRDRTGSYDLAFELFIFCVLLSALLISATRFPGGKGRRPELT